MRRKSSQTLPGRRVSQDSHQANRDVDRVVPGCWKGQGTDVSRLTGFWDGTGCLVSRLARFREPQTIVTSPPAGFCRPPIIVDSWPARFRKPWESSFSWLPGFRKPSPNDFPVVASFHRGRVCRGSALHRNKLPGRTLREGFISCRASRRSLLALAASMGCSPEFHIAAIACFCHGRQVSESQLSDSFTPIFSLRRAMVPVVSWRNRTGRVRLW